MTHLPDRIRKGLPSSRNRSFSIRNFRSSDAADRHAGKRARRLQKIILIIMETSPGCSFKISAPHASRDAADQTFTNEV